MQIQIKRERYSEKIEWQRRIPWERERARGMGENRNGRMGGKNNGGGEELIEKREQPS